MKTIQHLTQHQFSAKSIKTGDQLLAFIVTLLAFCIFMFALPDPVFSLVKEASVLN